MRRIYDVSVPVRSGGLVYPGNPEIRFEPQQQMSQGAGANVTSISLGSHSGTHVDAVKHFIDDGATVDEIPLEKLVGPAVLIDIDHSADSITSAMLAEHGLGGHTRVLLRTRNSSWLSDPEFRGNYTYLAPDGAQYLVENGVELVGIDYLSIEQFRSGHHRTHRTLLGKGVVIVEGLDFSQSPPGEYDFVCLPLRLHGLDGAPARAILISRESGATPT